MDIPKELFTIILQFACDYTSNDLVRHQKKLLPGIRLINRLEQCWNDYIYDDKGEYVTHTRTVYQIVWYLDSIDSRGSYPPIKYIPPIVKTLSGREIKNSYHSFDRERLIVDNQNI